MPTHAPKLSAFGPNSPFGNRIVNSRTSWGSADHRARKARRRHRRSRRARAKSAHGSTPTSAFDPAAGKDVYEPEKIIGQRLSKGFTTFNVKWVGWADKDNTWEPIEQHLVADCDLAQCRIELQPQEAARSTPPTRTILQSTIKNQRCTRRPPVSESSWIVEAKSQRVPFEEVRR